MLKNTYYQNKIYNRFMLAAFLVYGVIMFFLLFLRGNPHDTIRYNLVPFQTVTQYLLHMSPHNTDIWVKNLFGNIILFIPLGVAFPTLNKGFMRLLPFTLLIMTLLFTVEILQMVTRVGVFDVDDLILNALGALIGFGITTYVYRILNKYKVLN